MSVLLKNGLVVTATGVVRGGRVRRGRPDQGVGTGLVGEGRRDGGRPAASTSCPGPSTRTPTSTCPSWAPPPPTTGRPVRSPRPAAGTTTHHRLQPAGQGREPAGRGGEAEGARRTARAVVDYSIHPGVTDARPGRDRRGEEGHPRVRHAELQDLPVLRLPGGRLRHDPPPGGDEEARRPGAGARRELRHHPQPERAARRRGRHAGPAVPRAGPRRAAPRSRPWTAATTAVEFTGSRIYIVHLSSGRGLWKIRQARDRGLRVYAETCPQYLTLNEDRYDEPGLGRGQVRDVARRCAPPKAWRSCGRACATATSRPSAPTTARSTSRARRT